MAVFNIREVPEDLAKRVRITAVEREMSLKDWIIETITLRLDGKTETVRVALGKVSGNGKPAKEATQPKRAGKGHDSKSCRVVRCGMCKAAGVKDKNRGL
jgi:hypothetical protein